MSNGKIAWITAGVVLVAGVLAVRGKSLPN